MEKIARFFFAVILVISAVVLFFSVYRYDTILINGKQYKLRIHRPSQHTDVDMGDGWIPMEDKND